MTKDEHPGTGKYCGECMHFDSEAMSRGEYSCNPTADKIILRPKDGPDPDYSLYDDVDTGTWISTQPGNSACPHFIPSLKAQEVHQLRLQNELLSLVVRAIADPKSGDFRNWAIDISNQIGGSR